MRNQKKYTTVEGSEVNGDIYVWYAKEKHNEYKLALNKAQSIPDHVSIFIGMEECKKYIQSLNEFGDVLHKQSETPIDAPNTQNLATKTILEQIQSHEVDRLVFWEQYKVAETQIEKEAALLAMLQENSHIINKLKQYVHDTAK